MDEEITQILDAIKAQLLAEWPDIAVVVKAAPASGVAKPVQPGWTKGTAVPSFVVSSLEAEVVDTSGGFELVTLTYRCAIEYAKSGSPKDWQNDPDIRAKRMRLMELFYRNAVAGFPSSVFDGRYKPLDVYAGDESGAVVVSGQVFEYTLTVPRPDA